MRHAEYNSIKMSRFGIVTTYGDLSLRGLITGLFYLMHIYMPTLTNQFFDMMSTKLIGHIRKLIHI